ncbi:L-cysteine S-thiosulfotransferase [Thiorhodovibrio litoralis]|nr:sulfur oxidation c-type cytochrome SoxX [Thiorhodovibrio winogradskyi]WPL12597.1 L-cysteine S-thiosulfotransferase [Thiorhodovibrio litoralis]
MFLFSPERQRTGLAFGLASMLVLGTGSAMAMELDALTLNGNADAGRAVAMDRSTGNCIACHVLPGGEAPGAIGPPLVAMQTRYPSKHAVAERVWDATVKAPDAAMPPFGRHNILTEQQFVDVVEYVWGL